MARPLPMHVPGGEGVELVEDQRHELGENLAVASFPLREEPVELLLGHAGIVLHGLGSLGGHQGYGVSPLPTLPGRESVA